MLTFGKIRDSGSRHDVNPEQKVESPTKKLMKNKGKAITSCHKSLVHFIPRAQKQCLAMTELFVILVSLEEVPANNRRTLLIN